MTTFTVDNVTHEEEDLNDNQKKLVHEVSINQNAIHLFNEVLDSLKKSGTIKLGDLRDTLATVTEKSNGKDT
tara:strand:+ start:87 stop:302 length:216 start_codon:yes stop_codon:yes gene_type:complete